MEKIGVAARDYRLMTVPPEAEGFTTGSQFGPLAAFRTTFTMAGRHEEPSLFVFFMPSPRLDYAIAADSKKIDLRSVGSSSLFCKMPGMPSTGDKTGRCSAVMMAGVDSRYIRSIAEDLFDMPRLELPFRCSELPESLELDLHRFLSALPADRAERSAVAECLVPLISVGFLLGCLPELIRSPILRHGHPGIGKARKLMEREFRSPLSIRELAAAAGLGRSQFIAAFKKQVGSTPHDFLRRLRINEAKRRLARGAGVTETAFEVGFSSLGGFEEAFARLVGIRPHEYREKSKP